MTEPEPGGWELMRSINSLRESVDKLAAGMVTQGTLAIIQAAQKQTDDRQDARLKELETELAEARKTKAQQWFAIGLSILGIVGTIIAGVIVFNLNRGVG
ncbi:hypothetical protein [Agromyces aureus]|uniref:Uncharacterized protein n=2 Tax=Agromyces aureus TaxID=453304 RepID=A0A191WEX3_9MICO|nr:hypothetical protein [Agromyces aureus]ANJ26830.1 hypothetical protein ATC03_08960 [Agromyces aureus]